MGFAAEGDAGLFPCPPPPCSRRPSARRVTAWLRASLTCRLFRAPSPSFRPSTFRCRACCQGLVPSSRHHRRASTRSEDSSLTRFRPQALSASRRFSPLAGSGACCIPEPRPGHRHRSGASLPAQPFRLVAGPCPRTVGEAALTGRHSPAATRQHLGFEALLHAGARSHRRGCTPRRRPLPSSVSTPPGPPPLGSGLAYRDTSARAVRQPGLRLRDGRAASTPACHPRGRALLSPETPTRSRFLACSRIPIKTSAPN